MNSHTAFVTDGLTRHLGSVVAVDLPALGISWGGFVLYTVLANLAA